MSNPTFADVHGFAGAFALGAVQAGFQLVTKCEDVKGFGIPAFIMNPHIYGDNWLPQQRPPAEWEPVTVDLVIGNPPCSGFSGLNTVRGTARSRGVDSEINQCMHDFITYAAKCHPKIVIMESVQAAFTSGRVLMDALAAKMNDLTGQHYYVHHVLQNNLSVGGCSNRPRYFLVLSLVPFGVEKYQLERVPALRDAIWDLAFVASQWEQQVLPPQARFWTLSMRLPSGKTDGCMPMVNAHYRRLMDLVSGDKFVSWNENETELQILERYWNTWATLPESWDYESKGRDGLSGPRSEVLVKRGFEPHGFSHVLAWKLDQPARVLTGAGPNQWFNALAGRMPTHRECARIMGYPDWFQIAPLRDVPGLGAYWGKQTSVHPALWICWWALRSLADQPGSIRDTVINVTHDWKPLWRKQQAEILSA